MRRSLIDVDTVALVPVKAFSAAKGRLAGWLTPDQRQHLARRLAAGVLASFEQIPVFVACDDDAVADWADSLGATVLWGPGLGLNGAIDAGVSTLAGKGADTVVIAHGDLPRPGSLPTVARPGTFALIPDDRLDGTNVMAMPTAAPVRADYGAGSFRRHLAAAIDSGLPVTVQHHPLLSIDIDTVNDCRHPRAQHVVESILETELPA